MCSILGYTSKSRTMEELRPFFDQTKSRGPDDSRMEETPSGYLGFHRLAIMGLTPVTPTARSSCPSTMSTVLPCSPCWIQSLPW